ncbi:MAG: transglutaminase domain-containing protein [Pseudomonadota bacterium]
MSLPLKIFFLLLLSGALLAVYLVSTSPQSQIKKVPVAIVEKTELYPLTSRILYSYNLTNRSAKNITKADFYAYTPVPKTPYQRLDSLDSKTPHVLTEDKFGNQIIHFKIKNLAPYASQTIKIIASLAMAHKPNNIPFSNIEHYLENSELLNLDQPEVILLAKKLNHGSISEIVNNTFLWTMRNIKYSGYEQADISVVHTLESKSGDCTDYMHVFTALNRINSIPTREIAGYIVKQNKIIHAHDYHNWAEYLLDDYWYLADPQNKNFNQFAGYYIAFKHYGVDRQSPLDDFHRYYVSDKRILATMN